MTIDERIELAKTKVEQIINLLRTLIQLRSNNEFFLYTDALSGQVGESYAANAFNVLQSSLYEIELVRLCAIWDPANNEQRAVDRNSLPALRWLLEPEAVVEALAQRIKEFRLTVEIRDLGPNSNRGTREWLDRVQGSREEEAAKVKKRLSAAVARIAEIAASDLQVGLRDFRNKHVAHSLVQSDLERRGKIVVSKYGHEKELLDKTIEISSELYYGVCDASFHWPSAWKNSMYCAEALLSKAALNVVR